MESGCSKAIWGVPLTEAITPAGQGAGFSVNNCHLRPGLRPVLLGTPPGFLLIQGSAFAAVQGLSDPCCPLSVIAQT